MLSGGELALLRLLPHMTDVEAHVLLGEDGPLVERLKARRVAVEVLPLAPSARTLHRHEVGLGTVLARGLPVGAYVVQLMGRLRRLRPDLVHTNSLKAGLYGSVAARAVGVPVVWHLRDRISEDYLPSVAVRGVRLALAHLPTAVIANSKATLETAGKVRRGSVVHDPCYLRPVTRERAPGEPLTVGIVGRLAPWKGQHLFLDAFARAFTCGNERALIVGSPLFGEVDYETSLRRQAVELGLGPRVSFTGFREDVASELARMDVLVLASTIPEPFGQVVVEGMAAGLPVVAPSAGGPAEVIDDGRSGLLYRPGDADALATLLQRLSRRPDHREQLSRAAATAAEKYRPPRIAAQMMDRYLAVLDQGRH